MRSDKGRHGTVFGGTRSAVGSAVQGLRGAVFMRSGPRRMGLYLQLLTGNGNSGGCRSIQTELRARGEYSESTTFADRLQMGPDRLML
jgi:hypothetical protein